MIRYLRNGALAAALLGAAFSSPSAAAAAVPARMEYKRDQVILMKEQGKPDRRCVIISAKKQSDGSITYQVKALDNGDIITIHDRPPSSAKKQTPTNTTPAANATNGVKRPPDITNITSKAEANLPRAKPRSNDPLLNPGSNEPLLNPPAKPRSNEPLPGPVTPTAYQPPEVSPNPAPQPEREKPRFRLFGRTEKPPTPNAARTIPGTAHSTEEPPLAQVQQEPLPITNGPRLPMTVPVSRPDANEPAPLARSNQQASLPRPAASEPAPMALYQAPLDLARQTADMEKDRFEDLRDALKYALRPSERMAAAEALCAPTRITDPENRAAVMLSAQDDPAGVVRAACIRGMSRSGVRDQAFIALLVACQKDHDPSVRVEANLAIQKATRR